MSNQDKTTYYYVNNERKELRREPSVRALKFKDGTPEIPRLSSNVKTLLPDTSRMQYIPKYGLHIYQTTIPSNQLTQERLSKEFSELRELGKDEGNIEFISAAYRLGSESNDLLFTTKEFNVRFKPDTTQQDIDKLITKYGVKIVRKLTLCG